MRSTFLRIAPLVAAAALLAACGGGGGGGTSTPAAPSGGGGTGTGGGTGGTPTATPTPAFLLPGPSAVNPGTTYTVYSATINGSLQVAITPLSAGPPDGVNGWSVVTSGAIITYPDGSSQLSDTLGNFDAANPNVAWVSANASALAANPQFQPEILVSLLGVTNQVPLDTYLPAYAPPQATVVASVERSPLAGRRTSSTTTTSPELTSVTVFPRGVAMFDNERRTFTLVGSDSDGQYVDLSGASVAWKVAKPAGCSDPAGTLRQPSSSDAARVIYTPPASGTFVCPDLITATATTGSGPTVATFSANANAYWYDPTAGVAWSGTLLDATSKPVQNGLVYLYGGGREFYRGNLVAFTNPQGQFSRTIPPNRTMVPVGGNLSTTGGRAAASFFALSPSTVVAGASGTTLAGGSYTEGVAFQNPYKPLPAYDRALRDATFIVGVAQDQFPFGRPLATGKYPKCSIDAIVNKQSDSLACAKVGDNGYFDNWTIATPNASTWVFQQPASQEGGRHALQVASASSITAPYGISDTTTKAITCTAPQACFSFLRVYSPIGLTSPIPGPIASANGALSGLGANTGVILAVDGGFAEIANAGGTNGAFTAYYVRNEYTVGHQIQGQPLYAHTLAYTYSGASNANVNVANAWYNTFGNAAGTLNVTFTPSAAAGSLTGSAPLYTYSGTGTRQYYKSTAGGQTPSALYAFSLSGQQNYDHSASAKVTLTQSPDPVTQGGSVSLTFNAPFAACPSGYPAPANGTVARICATMDQANLPAGITLTSGHVALYTVDPNLVTTVSLDPVFGTQAAAFHL